MRLGAPLKFMVFAVIMTVLTGFLIMVFGNFRGGSTGEYSAVFADTSRLKAGDSVRVAGVVVGTVDDVALQQDHKVVVSFAIDRSVVLTEGTQAAVRYLNLVGDRYLELRDAPGPARLLAAGAQIPVERTEPALDLDLLLGGLKPVLRSLNAADVDAFSFALVQILQGQGGTLESLFSRTSSFSAAVADNSAVVAQAIEKLNVVTNTLADNGQQFSDSVDRLQRLVTGLAAERDPIGTAIEQLSAGTASVADLLADGRAPLAAIYAPPAGLQSGPSRPRGSRGRAGTRRGKPHHPTHNAQGKTITLKVELECSLVSTRGPGEHSRGARTPSRT